MRTHYSHRIHFPRGPSTPTITLPPDLIYAIDVWHSVAVQSLFSHIIYIGWWIQILVLTPYSSRWRCSAITDYLWGVHSAVLCEQRATSLCSTGKAFKGAEWREAAQVLGTDESGSFLRLFIFLWATNIFESYWFIRFSAFDLWPQCRLSKNILHSV